MVPLRALYWGAILATFTFDAAARCDEPCLPWIKPEQRQIRVRHPSQLPHVALPLTPRPPTVTDTQWDAPERPLSLDEAIRTALGNTEMVRVLGGVAASSSGRSIYDAAITNTEIDVAQGRFDPTVLTDSLWSRLESPPLFQPQRRYDLDFTLSKTNLAGGTWAFGVTDNPARTGGFLSEPSSLALRYDQPLLQGGGKAFNQAPIVLARIDTERSYFQFKNSVQQSVNDVIAAYWSLVTARTVLWAREQQVIQAQFALEQAENRAQVGDISEGEVAQPRVSLANFRSTLIGAKANVLQQEAALRSILGLPPYEPQRITPVSPPSDERISYDWDAIVEMAEVYRPDIIELKLILEADQQRLVQARNTARPQLNASGLYRWNGLNGILPLGEDWTLGVTFSVPLGLRAGRAQFRQQELLIARDRANLTQGLQTATYLLAANLRNLEQFYEQYRATQETRAAARVNLEYQMARYRTELIQYINVLQAIVSWGDAVISEAQLLSQYNIEQANLELQTGTILETHGVFFFEERNRSLGPLGCVGHGLCYPRDKRPTDNLDIYPRSDEPSEEFFDLTNPLQEIEDRGRRDLEVLPPLEPPPPSEPLEPYPMDPTQRQGQPSTLLPVPETLPPAE